MSSLNGSAEAVQSVRIKAHAPAGTKCPLLSVLIPAYCYPEGIARILGGLGTFDPDLIEILIGDDSPEAAVEAVVQRSGIHGVYYQRNSPPLGAPANWNALLVRASGEFCLMMHHDEFPLSADFLQRVLRRLRNARSCDVFLLDCVLVNPRTGWNRRHLPFALRMAAISHVPGYLLRRNVVGPVSVLVVRRSKYPRFDPQLKWLVDVDLYLRLFTHHPATAACHEIVVGSVLGRKESITGQLGINRESIAVEERCYLLRKHGRLAVWCNEGAGYLLAKIAEQWCWIFLRMVMRLWARPLPVARQAAIRALQQTETCTGE